MGPVQKAINEARAKQNTQRHVLADMKRAGKLDSMLNIGGNAMYGGRFDLFGSGMGQRQKYAKFRGWVYAAVNALAEMGAGQAVNIGMLSGSRSQEPQGDAERNAIFGMTKDARSKAARHELKVLPEHPLLDALERPNNIQYRFQFVYTFIANLALTGWGYIIGDTTDDGKLEFFSIPTSWVKPDHSDGAFRKFRIVNPNAPAALDKAPVFTDDQVVFAYLPNPADPMAALSPTQAQHEAVDIDNNIQSSQQQFFRNGIFPSVIITMGRNPHPDVPGGIRPRLTGAQRREVYGAIRKVSGGVSNYGNPAIVDGLIEKIDRLSATSNEMGWEKSEKAIRTRILSAFGVHPFMLGDEMAGSYAQAYVVQDRFCAKVNTYLNLLGTIMSEFGTRITESDRKLLVWWEKCRASDPGLEHRLWRDSRDRDDISQNEMRSYMNLPPDQDRNESIINRMSANAIASIATNVTEGKLTPEQAKAILVGMGLPDYMAENIAGTGPDVSTTTTPVPPPPNESSDTDGT